MKMKIFAALLLSFCTTQLFGAEKAANFGEMFTKGVYDVKLRLAYEYSDVDNGNVSPGKGLVLSSYAGYRTAEYEGFSLYAQVHNLWKIDDEYNDLRGKYAGENDVIADPDGTRIQQLYADLTMIPDTKIRIGRQEIVLDDVRFIGNIGWRNTAQAFDAVTLTNTSIKDTTIFLGYADNVASILFKENEYDGIYLANVKYEGFKGHTQTAFAYLVDRDEDEGVAGPSIAHDAATYGFRANGWFEDFGYDLTYAHQTDWQDTDDLSLNFFQGILSYKMGKFTPAIGYSYIQGNGEGGKAFSTLFSTAHKWNGWADQFLSTNAGGLVNGLQDFNVSLNYKNWGTLFRVAYHYFDTTENGGGFDGSYGQEFDFLVSKKINKNLTATAKLSYYDKFSESDAGNPTADELVFWLRLDYNFSAPVADPFAIN
ncbi:MAG: alginate export family protein [Lentisphaeraceae bacterium]|nr:alginate export family protein [Lentisphaeraceae bacterium]